MTSDAELDQRLVLVASKIRVLGALSFPEQTLERFAPYLSFRGC